MERRISSSDGHRCRDPHSGVDVNAVGRRLRRVEDPPLLTGAARFVADVVPDGALAMRVVRSSVAHGELLGVDGTEAEALPGVRAVITADHLREWLGDVPRIRSRLGADAGTADAFFQPVLAVGRVRYVGEPVAVVVTDDPYVAEDAAELVSVDVQPLDAVVDPRTAADGPALFPEGNTYKTLHGRLGDPEAAFANAPVVVEAELVVDRHTAVPLETRGVVAVPDKLGSVTLYGSSKVLHWNRDEIARHLHLDPRQVRLVETAVGGSFGVRGELYPEDTLAAAIAVRLGAPVVWIEDRYEHFLATNHGRGQVHRAAIAGTADGCILAIRSEMWVDLGAYVRTNGLRVPEITVGMLPGPYALEHYGAVAHVVATNCTPVGTYRGPGRAESAFVRERLVDMYAHRIGRDAVDVRRANLLGIHPDGRPFERRALPSGPGIVITSADYEGLLDRVLERVDTAAVTRRQEKGERVGVGVGLFLERSGIGPKEWASLTVEDGGHVVVRTAATSVGQGVRTALAQVTADALGCDPDDVRVEPADTAEVARGTGTFGSRSTTMAGNAVRAAAIDLLAAARALVAAEAGVDPAEVSRVGGRWGAADRTFDLADVVKLLAGHTDGLGVLSAEGAFEMTQPNSDFGAHAAVVAVDPRTGVARVEHLVLGFDLGPAVNPTLVEGQLRGAALQAVGGALYERFAYDEQGTPQVVTFMDYLTPTAAEAPRMDIVLDEEHPSAFNPLGLKGVGEGGMTGVMPAVAAAISNAWGDPGLVCRAPVGLDDLRRAASDPPGPPIPVPAPRPSRNPAGEESHP